MIEFFKDALSMCPIFNWFSSDNEEFKTKFTKYGQFITVIAVVVILVLVINTLAKRK